MPPAPTPRRRTGPALAVGIVVLVVALLGGGVLFLGSGGDDEDGAADRAATDPSDGGDEPDADPSDDPDAFVEVPMPGGPTEPEPTTPPDPIPSEGEPVDLTVVQLEEALLSPMDLPDLQPEMTPEPQTSDRLTSAQMTVTDECRALLEDHEARGTRPNFGGAPAAAPRYAARLFSASDMTIEHELADGAEVTIDEYRELLTACETIEWEGGGRLRFTVLDEAPQVGDEALRVEYAFGGSESIVQWVLWSRDGVIASVNVSQVGGAPGEPSSRAARQLEEAAYLADEQLAMVIAER